MEKTDVSFVITAALGAVGCLIPKLEHQMVQGCGPNEVLTKLKANLTTLGALLRDAENRSIHPTEIKEWLKKSKSMICGAESVMDDLEYEALRRKVELSNLTRNKVRDFFSFSNPWLFHLKVVHKLNRINSMSEEICQTAENIGLRRANDIGFTPACEIQLTPADNNNLRNAHVQPREFRSKSPLDYSKGFGLDSHVSILRDMLLGVGSGREGDDLSLIAIVGIGGVGKTTVAQLVYKDEEVVENFDANVMWISASDDFDIKMLLNLMMNSLTRRQSETPNGDVEKIKRGLEGKLVGKKYLLVLDGIWNTNAQILVDMRNWLLGVGDSRGSKLLVTTRTREVVWTMETFPSIIYNLDELSSVDSWTIFRKKAFADGGPRETDTLVKIGRRIVEKCKGLPFLIESVADLLHSKQVEEEWSSIENEETWSSVLEKINFLQLLRTSFDRLPSPSLKRCFAYCSVFPKGSVIKKDELIQIWMNLGYLHPSPDRDMEELGAAYFRVLLLNSLVQEVETDDYKNITSCEIPNHMHDLAMHVCQSSLEPSERKSYLEVQHCSLDFWKETRLEFPKRNVEKLRTLLPKVFHVRRTLAFSLFGDDVEKFPSSIHKLMRLRYLDLSKTSIQKLPNFITKLYNLQTLKLPKDLSEIPKDFHKLVSLRHFCMADTPKTRTLMPIKIGQLIYLQILPFFVVGKDSGRRIKELGSLSKLRGRLHVYSLQHVEGKEEAKEAKISEKLGIQELGFHWDNQPGGGGDTNTSNQQVVLEELKPHENIQGLIVENFRGQSFPSWTVLLKNLVKIELRGCTVCEEVPSLGQLRYLEIIEIVGLNNLKRIGSEFCGSNDGAQEAAAFPALKKLTLDDMKMLDEWSLPDNTRRADFFPNLEELYISCCPEFINIPAHLFSIQELIISSEKLSNADGGKRFHPCLTICSPKWNFFIEDLLKNSSNSLRKLTIKGLDELGKLPDKLWNLVSLEKLEIIDCPDLKSDTEGREGFDGLTSLQHVSIKRCTGLTHFPEGLIQKSLETLELDSCPSLEITDIISVTSIMNLIIRGCPSLSKLVENRRFSPRSLQRLEIGDFSNELQSFPWPFAIDSAPNANIGFDIQQCPNCSLSYASTGTSIAAAKHPQQFSFMSLTSLHLWGWEKLAHLPEGLQHLTTLTELSIHFFHLLQALPDWLANISSLQSLKISNCKNLTSFPRERLSSLQHLHVENCPLLRKRCTRVVGLEWHKIAHIPSVQFSATST